MEFPKIFAVAAGWIKTVGAVRNICRSDVTHIVVGSFTPLPRDGNLGSQNFHIDDDGTSYNSLGLPNHGVGWLFDWVPEMIKVAGDKTIVVSLAGFSATDYSNDLQQLYKQGVRLVELNLGCPNVYQDGKQKPIASFDFDYLETIIASVKEAVRSASLTEMRFWAKVSPMTDPEARARLAGILLGFYECIGIVASNTIPNGRPLDSTGNPILGVSNGYGGVAGTALKPISLINAEHYVRLIDEHRMKHFPNVAVIGCGGIRSYADVLDYQRVGCQGVAIGTAFFQNDDHRLFQNILAEYVDQNEEENP